MSASESSGLPVRGSAPEKSARVVVSVFFAGWFLATFLSGALLALAWCHPIGASLTVIDAVTPIFVYWIATAFTTVNFLGGYLLTSLFRKKN